MNKERVIITYKTADGKKHSVEVTPEIKEVLETTDRKLRTQAHYDRSHLTFMEDVQVAELISPFVIYEDIADTIGTKEENQELHKAIKTLLTETQRYRLYLRFFEKMSYAEIARLEGVVAVQ